MEERLQKFLANTLVFVTEEQNHMTSSVKNYFEGRHDSNDN